MRQDIKQLVEEYALSCKEEQESLLMELGKIPAPTRKEEQRAAFCQNWFKLQGMKNVKIDTIKNAIVEIDCDKYEDIVVFMAHTDIVFPDLEPLLMKQEGRTLHAPGIGDDTSNLVNLMMATKYIVKQKLSPKTGILVVANACEEGLGNIDGCKEIFKTYGSRIKEFYSFDGYMSQCCGVAVGSHRYKVTVKTEGGHSYLDFGKDNAIELLSQLVTELYKIEVPTDTKTTYNVGYIQGGTTVNTVAQEAHMLYEFRSIAQSGLEVMEKKFLDTVAIFKQKGINIEVEILGIRPGNGPVPQDKLKAFTEKNAEVISNFYSGEIDYGAYSTDGNIPLSMGIVANTIGTVIGDKAHTREEWVDLDSLSAGLKIVLSLMLEYMDI